MKAQQSLMVQILILLQCCLLSASLHSAGPEPQTVRLGLLQLDYEPYQKIEGDQVSGIDIALIREIFRRIPDVELKIELMPVTRVINAFRAGDLDVGVGFESQAYRRDAYLSRLPLHLSEYRLITQRSRQQDFQSLADLENKRIGVILGGSINPDIDRAIKEGRIDTLSTKDFPTQLKLLRGNRVDAIISNAEVMNWYSKRLGIREQIAILPLDITPTRHFHLGLSRRSSHIDGATLIAEVDRAMASMQDDGSWQRIVLDELSKMEGQ